MAEYPSDDDKCKRAPNAVAGCEAVSYATLPDSRGTPVIGVLDDDQAVLHTVADFLVAIGYRAATFSSVDEYLSCRHLVRLSGLILDVRLCGADGIEAIPLLKATVPQLPIVVMTSYGDVAVVIRALQAGVVDFLEKPFSMERLLDAMRRLLQRDQQAFEARRRIASLTTREAEVMQLLARGRSNKEIALEFEISPRTVESHRKAIMMKLELPSFAALVQIALLAGYHAEDVAATAGA